MHNNVWGYTEIFPKSLTNRFKIVLFVAYLSGVDILLSFHCIAVENKNFPTNIDI